MRDVSVGKRLGRQRQRGRGAEIGADPGVILLVVIQSGSSPAARRRTSWSVGWTPTEIYFLPGHECTANVRVGENAATRAAARRRHSIDGLRRTDPNFKCVRPLPQGDANQLRFESDCSPAEQLAPAMGLRR